MQNPDENQLPINAKLQIHFPKSSEDRRLQLIEINGSIFAIVHSPLESNGPINLFCENWSLILLSPIRSKVDISISGINVICLNDVISSEGTVDIQASNQLVNLSPSIQTSEKINLFGKQGQFQLDDDPATFLYYFKLFDKIVRGVHDANPDSFSEAQHSFLVSLCALAQKIEGKTEDLNIHKVLSFWEIAKIKEV